MLNTASDFSIDSEGRYFLENGRLNGTTFYDVRTKKSVHKSTDKFSFIPNTQWLRNTYGEFLDPTFSHPMTIPSGAIICGGLAQFSFTQLNVTNFKTPREQELTYPKPEIMERPKARELFVTIGGSVDNPILYFPRYAEGDCEPINATVLRWNKGSWEILAESDMALKVYMTRHGGALIHDLEHAIPVGATPTFAVYSADISESPRNMQLTNAAHIYDVCFAPEKTIMGVSGKSTEIQTFNLKGTKVASVAGHLAFVRGLPYNLCGSDITQLKLTELALPKSTEIEF